MDQTKIDRCVETLSRQGCTEVWKIISLLEQGHGPEEVASLTREERQAVLHELKAIMAVYQGRK